MSERNVAASVRARLLNRARETKQDFNLVLTRYAIERLLYRVSLSTHANNFLLKGALLFDLWFDIPHRPTRDIDLLGFGSIELPDIENVFKDICSLEINDGVVFLAQSVRAIEIRSDANYSGARVLLLGMIENARCQIQIDIGSGDAVTPGPEYAQYPVMFEEFEAPRLRAYPRYTVVAEKFEALTVLGIANSRMKDYFDLWILSRYCDFEGDVLRHAVQATFNARNTILTRETPFGLTLAFAQDAQKDTQWQAFLRKNKLEAPTLNEIIEALVIFMQPVFEAASDKSVLSTFWHAGGPWSVDR